MHACGGRVEVETYELRLTTAVVGRSIILVAGEIKLKLGQRGGGGDIYTTIILAIL